MEKASLVKWVDELQAQIDHVQLLNSGDSSAISDLQTAVGALQSAVAGIKPVKIFQGIASIGDIGVDEYMAFTPVLMYEDERENYDFSVLANIQVSEEISGQPTKTSTTPSYQFYNDGDYGNITSKMFVEQYDAANDAKLAPYTMWMAYYWNPDLDPETQEPHAYAGRISF